MIELLSDFYASVGVSSKAVVTLSQNTIIFYCSVGDRHHLQCKSNSYFVQKIVVVVFVVIVVVVVVVVVFAASIQ
jgi:hypothetical protein